MKTTKKRFTIESTLLVMVSVLLFATSCTQTAEKKGGAAEAYPKFFQQEAAALKASLVSTLDNLESSGFGNSDKPKDDSLATALSFYETFKYEEARVSLVSFLEAHPNDKIANFYLGLTLMQQSEYAKASKLLRPLTSDGGFADQDAAQWYLALCYSMFETEAGEKDTQKLMKSLAYDSNSGYAAGAKNYMEMMGWQ